MDKSVVLQFVLGSFKQGFVVTLRIEQDGNRLLAEAIGKLPPAPEIPQYYRHWHNIYFNLGLSLGLPFRLEAPESQVTNYSIQDCNNAAQLLCNSLNTWLRSESFLSVREKVLTVLASIGENDEVRVFIKSQDLLLQRLPWHLCDLFENFPRAEIALVPSDPEAVPRASTPRTKANILAIFGSSQGINTEEDRALLSQLPNAEVTFLVNPRRYELNDQLWDQNWPILFFAGHSSSQDQGRIYINERESLTINDLKNALKRALANGLKLAIFNSCDGLRLARALADLHIPLAIVMREPVPDQVAQAFLRYFLQAFARGQSVYLAVREARERLQGMEGQFPCATWLPIICQNPSEKPPRWSDLFYRPRISSKVHIGIAIGLVLLASAVTVAVIHRLTSPPLPRPVWEKKF